MGKTKKQRKIEKSRKLRNKKLIKKYSWLMPRDVWTGNKLYDYDYDFTEYDCVGEGWQKAFGMMMLKEIDEELKRNHHDKKYLIYQVKEKYGSLCYYDNGGANETTSKYDRLSQNICYFCGRPDVPMTNLGWILPVCKKCYEKKWRRGSKYEYEEVICDENPRMADVYHVKRFSKDRDEIITYDYSKTTNKIRKWWNKNHPDDQVELYVSKSEETETNSGVGDI